MTPRILAFVLLVLFAMQSFQQNLIVLDYVANAATYIESCINKDRPELACKGKCQMLKKIKAEEEKKSQNPDSNGQNKSTTLYPLPVVAFTLQQPDEPSTTYCTHTESFPIDRAATIFHPPALF